MSAAEPEEAFVDRLHTTDSLQEGKMGKKLQKKFSESSLPLPPAVIIVLTGAVIALSVALSLSDTSNWTFSQNFCMEREAQLAQFDNMEELNFLKRYKGTFGYWISLHRESPEHPWRWMDNTEYNSSVPIRGVEKHAYLNSNGISSARIYADKRWICSKPNSCVLK